MPLLISACCSAICNCRTLLRKLQADLHCRLLLAYARQKHVGAHCFVHYSSDYASGYSDVYLMARMRLKMRIGMRLRKGSGCHQAVSLTAALPSIHIITVSTASWHRLSDAFCSPVAFCITVAGPVLIHESCGPPCLCDRELNSVQGVTGESRRPRARGLCALRRQRRGTGPSGASVVLIRSIRGQVIRCIARRSMDRKPVCRESIPDLIPDFSFLMFQ